LQGPIHEAFIAHVMARRGARLVEADLFNADVCVGRQAVDLGLVEIMRDDAETTTHARKYMLGE
jgi:ClpP class serine protease